MKNAKVFTLASILLTTVLCLPGYSQERNSGWLPDAKQWETKTWNRFFDYENATKIDTSEETEVQQALRQAYDGSLKRKDIYRAWLQTARFKSSSEIVGSEGQVKMDFTPDYIKEQGFENHNYVVMISADWCKWCKKMYPDLLELRKKGYIVYIFETNRPEFKNYAALYKATAYPTFIVFDGGKEVDRTVGKTEEKWFTDRLVVKDNQKPVREQYNPYKAL